uniref:Ig-like domain-containing protein n=1 Tax=Pygocentrus nattereri TaxID=42514 RepID=A0A3B4CVJ3_PYGNA
MAARALTCTLTLLVWAGVSLGQLVLPNRQNGAVGGNVEFKPISFPSDTYQVITWRFGETIVIKSISGSVSIPRPEYRGRVSLDINTLALELRNLTMGDTGVYILTADTAASSYSAETTLKVFVNVSGATITGPTGLVIEGNSANLSCDASGTIVTTEWMKNNQKLSPSNNIIFSADNRSVSISAVGRMDSGEYRCTLSNPVSSDSDVFTMTVNYGPDNVRIEGPSEVEERGSVMLLCSAESVPDPRYAWTFNGTNTGVTTDSLTMDQVTFSNSGTYTCTAWNNVTRRETSASHSLVVREIGSLSGGVGSLSAGAIAGIVIGVLLGVALVAGLIVYFTKFAGRPKSSSRGVKQNGATQNGGEHELNYADIRHFQNNQSVLNMGGTSTQTRQGTPAMVRAHRGANQGAKPEAEVTYSEVRK